MSPPEEAESAAVPSKVAPSPVELYQMAVPHIIESNLRVQRIISQEKKKLRVHISFQKLILLFPNLYFTFLETLLGKS